MLFLGLEVSQNFEYMLTLPGFGKVLTLVFGVITLGLGGSSYEDDLENIWKEVVFIIAVIVCLGVSFLYLAAHCFLDQLVINKWNRLIDFGFHVLAAIFYIVSGSLLIDSAVEIGSSTNCRFEQHLNLNSFPIKVCEFFGEKLGGGIFGIVTGITYAFTAVAIAMVKNL